MHTTKIPYKIENLLNEAEALYDLFNILTTNKEKNAKDLSEKLIQNYELEGEHYKRFQKISERTERAQGIMRYLENKFGVDEQGYFIDKEMFYWDVLDKDIPKNTKLKSYNIAIANIQDVWKYKRRMGFANGFNYLDNPLHEPLETALEKIDKNGMNVLFFTIPSLEEYQKIFLNNDKNVNELGYKKIINHELRHVFDKIILDNDDFLSINYFRETPAYMYSMYSERVIGLEDDLKKGTYFLNKQIKIRKNRLERLTQIKAPEVILKNEESMLKNSAKKLSGIKTNIKFVRESLNEKFHASDKEIKSLSYFFSILPEEEVPYYLQKARKFYDERKISNEIKEEFKNLSDKI